jgi:hypothetical protein
LRNLLSALDPASQFIALGVALFTLLRPSRKHESKAVCFLKQKPDRCPAFVLLSTPH